jgi:hypothetical protein
MLRYQQHEEEGFAYSMINFRRMIVFKTLGNSVIKSIGMEIKTNYFCFTCREWK